MANEIVTSANLVIQYGGYFRQFQILQDPQDMGARNIGASGPQVIGTAAEALDIGTVQECGIAFFKNLSETDTIEIGVDSGGFIPFLRLGPGRTAGPLWLGTNAPYAKSDIGDSTLDYYIHDRGETT